MKPFKTHNVQLKILRDRGLEVPPRAKRDLENENYYNIINGYKDLFLECDDNSIPVEPERYIKGSHFNEIFALYKLDRRLRNTLLEYLLVFEAHIKSRISYFFSKKFPEPHSYLYFKNYSNDPRKTDNIVKTVASLSNTMSNRNNKPLKHYMNKHNGVPLWILVNYLTIGNINYMYKNLDDDLRKEIALDYKDKIKRDYKIVLDITPKDLDGILQQVNLFRNVCAHEERLYDYEIKKPKSLLNNYNNFKKLTINTDNLIMPINKSKLFDLLICLKMFLNKNDYKKLINNLEKTLDHYESDFVTASKNEIYEKMGCQTPNLHILK